MHQHPLGKMVPGGDNVGDGDVNDCGDGDKDDDDDYIIDIVAPVHFCKHGSGYN